MRYARQRHSTARIVVLAATLLLAACSSAPSPPAPKSLRAPSGLLGQTNLLYSSEVGAWEADGGPAVKDPAVAAKIRAARIPAIRFSVYDCFTGERCGRDPP